MADLTRDLKIKKYILKFNSDKTMAGTLGDVIAPWDILETSVEGLHQEKNVRGIWCKYMIISSIEYYLYLQTDLPNILHRNHPALFSDPNFDYRADFKILSVDECLKHFKDHCNLSFFIPKNVGDNLSAGNIDYYNRIRHFMSKYARRFVVCDQCDFRPWAGSPLEKRFVLLADTINSVLIAFQLLTPEHFNKWMQLHYFTTDYTKHFLYFCSIFEILFKTLIGFSHWTKYCNITVASGEFFLVKAYKLRTSASSLFNGSYGESMNGQVRVHFEIFNVIILFTFSNIYFITKT